MSFSRDRPFLMNGHISKCIHTFHRSACYLIRKDWYDGLMLSLSVDCNCKYEEELLLCNLFIWWKIIYLRCVCGQYLFQCVFFSCCSLCFPMFYSPWSEIKTCCVLAMYSCALCCYCVICDNEKKKPHMWYYKIHVAIF